MAIHNINASQAPSVHGSDHSRRSGALENEAKLGMPNGNAQQTDELHLSRESLRLQTLETSMKIEPPVDTQRVEALREAIASGEYRIDSNSVAEHLLEIEAQLFE